MLRKQFDYSRLDMLWEKYPKYHEKTLFSSLDQLLEEHESYQKDFDDALREEYIQCDYERFLVQLSWADLPYRQDTRKMIDEAGTLNENVYVSAFLEQLEGHDTEKYACFLFPESFTSQFFVVEEVCKRAVSRYFVPVSTGMAGAPES